MMSRLLRSAMPGVDPAWIGARSRIERGTIEHSPPPPTGGDPKFVVWGASICHNTLGRTAISSSAYGSGAACFCNFPRPGNVHSLTRRRPLMTSPMPGTDSTADELVLEPPAPVPTVTPAQATSAMRIDPATATQIQTAVNAYVESLTSLEAQSPAFEQKVASISRMGHEEIRRSAEASNRFLNRPTAALKQGPFSQGSEVSHALLSLRHQIESLDPSRHLGQRRGLFRRSPFASQVGDYFRKYQSAQTQIEAIVNGLYRGHDELMRDNAALEQEKVHLWEMKRRLDQYAYMAAQLDEALARKIAVVEATDPEKARALREDALFYVRQKRQDLLNKLSVTVQGYLAMDMIRKNNIELIKGVERATTT